MICLFIYQITIILVLQVLSPVMSIATSSQQRYLPQLNGPIIIGYASNPTSGKAERAIRDDGIHVIIWSFIHMHISNNEEEGDDNTALPTIQTSLDLKEIKKIRNNYEHVVHLAAFGGWNGPHPPGRLTGKQWFNIFHQFNIDNGYLFDGIDWDYEGHDDLDADTAKFTLETLDVMVDFSLEAKIHDMIVSMAPAESYLDASASPGSIDTQFSLDLGLPPRAWTSDRYNASDDDKALVNSKGFSHAGRQCYAYVLAKAGIEAFDWISIQFYEGYSPLAHDIKRGIDPAEAIMIRIQNIISGYTVTNLPIEQSSEYKVKIPANKIVVGIGNSWVDGLKFCRIEADSVRAVYERTHTKHGQEILGVMFWTIEEEGETGETRLTHQLKTQFTPLHQFSRRTMRSEI